MKGQVANDVSVRNCKSRAFWEDTKPSKIDHRPEWMTFDDLWVDEVRRVAKACVIFLWYPLYCMSSFFLDYMTMANARKQGSPTAK